jgi:hyperosmotically inducible protein
MKPIICVITFALSTSIPAICEDKPADNTGRNQRDKSGQNPTPTDQSNSAADLELTRTIRQAIVKDASLTATAKNVKIISSEGKVTLRGPVNTAEEKTKIERTAIDKAGSANVDSQLEVKTSR